MRLRFALLIVLSAAMCPAALCFGQDKIDPSVINWPTGGAGCFYAPGSNTCLTASGSIASTSNVLKGNGSGGAVAATPGTDYVVPGGGGGDYQSLMASITPTNCTVSGPVCAVTGTPVSFTLASIPQTFTNLEITCTIVGDNGNNFSIQFNGDAASNYFFQFAGTGGTGSTTTSALTTWGSTNAFIAGSTKITIFRYSSSATGFYKDYQAEGFFASQPGIYIIGGYWKNSSSAITSITFLATSGTLQSGTSCTLAGKN